MSCSAKLSLQSLYFLQKLGVPFLAMYPHLPPAFSSGRPGSDAHYSFTPSPPPRVYPARRHRA
eukprot:scaffold49043_cov69-Phaeocystis_antarctica.AAC.5